MVGHEKVIMVVSGAFIFDKENRLLLQQRLDNEMPLSSISERINACIG
jgi:isopentenyldiphosphate isomerase